MSINAQQRDQERMAVTYEQGGDARSAARIYLELLQGQPDNRRYFEGVVRTLNALTQYESLLPIIDDYANRHPSLEVFLLGGVTASKAGKPSDPYWESAEKLAHGSAESYAAIARAQASVLQSAKAVVLFERARQLSGQQSMFASDLGRLYSSLGNYDRAVQEIFKQYTMDGNEQGAKGLLAALMATPEGTKSVERGLDSLADDTDILRLRWWFLTQVHRWPEAYTVVQQLDNIENQRGRLILNFAETARMEQEYAVALKAFESLLNSTGSTSVAASYGYTATLEEQMAATGHLSVDDARTIYTRYRDIARTHAQNPLAADAMLRMATLQVEYLADTSEAVGILTALISKWGGTRSAIEGSLLLADLYYARGMEKQAQESLASVVKTSTPLSAIAELKLTDYKLYNQQLAEAKSEYLRISADPASPAANDALDRLGLLMLLSEDSSGVADFVRCMKLQAQGNRLGAARAYQHTAEIATDPDLQDRAHLESALMYFELRNAGEALAQLSPVLQKIPDSPIGDRALLLVANMKEYEGDKQGAITALSTLLAQYPRSILTPSCRERIRRLRGDV